MSSLTKFHGLENLKNATGQELETALQELMGGIKALDQEALAGMKSRVDAKIKPLGSLGVLEDIAQQLAGIFGTTHPQINKKAVLLMAGDHGVVVEGVSAAPQEITKQMFYSYLNGGAGINVLARNAGADVICTDIGIATPFDAPELMAYRVKNGTDNMAKGPAMTRQEAILAILTGARIAANAIDSGVNLLATGEVGIGNTTPSAALISVFTGHSVEDVTGRGTGLKDDALINKQNVIKCAIEINQCDPASPIDTLAKIGGLEIAALVGAILEASYQHVPIILDGIISSAAAITAAKLAPLSTSYMIASHSSEELGQHLALHQLGLKPRLDFHMRLGEGTGAALMFPMVEAALKVADEMATFEQAAVTTGDF
ncbi:MULTISPECIES: nicotinate-nucleotide--dimethylbenzimidazole phosphoribosyltransferase [unclassified Dehalobacter]|uniref:nicotinate-nucleotide--dimethylbenzimidazole phosphoribosyltransferase n=1 Tax=unclassified Dehalobacter TaxID=2635733 RepID=UPI000E6D22D5|nr:MULTISPECIES: nicotinate-nucleotide--dimethylbenzimidazole phosphoribosyltransferase [unclassified Dehalobacter]RJE47995.1 nicotinate-nucleotide--dimethylbenzimidazole phosphoribosyltransferase [Dehalobacter sp. MCB1]TCX50597.1 nicotinate-nucleotide--dimethylbenzimidazole phosphoribosyltransferase [Dehalobacter sp. 14DCB1]TCX52159.1 nicotinate-nucleotide--dimethylbenzimidazole phosphoribosyltransferase [Dehalobacter sp. 12DCB1]